MTAPISISSAPHYLWGDGCDGWHLLRQAELSIIQERVPAGKCEVMHHHKLATQFFFILDGEGVMQLDGEQIALRKGEGVEIPPGLRHRFCNLSSSDVHFLLISAPPAQGDRVGS